MSKKLPGLADLSPEQQEVVLSWGKGLAVLAGAGSGKTTTLVVKCMELLKLKKEARFAAVSFTERSASDLREKLALRFLAEPEAGSLSPHWVTTIHGLCASMIREYPREAGLDGEETLLSEPEAQLYWERAIETLWFDAIPDPVQTALDFLLERESREALIQLLIRMRTLEGFGATELIRKNEDPALRSLQVLAEYVIDRYTRQKRRQGVLDFDDLEKGADRVLNDPKARQALQKRFDLVLVDEFQDTNIVQARIISRFVKPDFSNLCVVGDPKQSIYRFRDADVSVFEDFCSKLPEMKVLTRNYRSLPGVIHYVNEVCAPAFEASEMRYDPLDPQRQATSGENPVIRLDVTDPRELASWIRQETDRGVPLHEMALLVRKVRGNEKWFKALTAAGIPLAVGSGGLFWEDARVRELVCFLKWWSNPGNAYSGAVFLRAPWVGVSDENVDVWVKEDPTLVKPFFSSGHLLAQVLEPFRSRPVHSVRPGEILMALLASEAIEQELGAPLLGLWHRVEELSSRGLDFYSVVAELSAAMKESRREKDVPPPKNLGQLSVLTIHGSKGLEFPHVILIDLGKKGREPNAPLLFWDRNEGLYLGTRAADGSREKDHPVEVRWRAEEKRKNLAESKRLFYVALTRARERLVLVCPELEEKHAQIDPEKVFEQDFWRGWVEMAGRLERATLAEKSLSQQTPVVAQSRPAPQARPKAEVSYRRPRHSVSEWSLLAKCPRSYEWTYIRPKIASTDKAESLKERIFKDGQFVEASDDGSMSRRELGTAVHGCLERNDWDGLRLLEEKVGSHAFRAEPVIGWASQSPWMAPADSANSRDVWKELSFEVPEGNEVLVGSIDRFVVDRENQTLIDFKVVTRAKSEASLIHAYEHQLELYAWALAKIDPSLDVRKMKAALVAISVDGVKSVEVGLKGIDVGTLSQAAAEIVAGKAGEPRPSAHCQVCDFRKQCPEAAKLN